MKFYEFLALTTKYDELLNYLCAKNVTFVTFYTK